MRARNSEALDGCGFRSPAPGVTFGFCQAQIGPADDQLAVSFNEDPKHLAAIAAMGCFSDVTFPWDASCHGTGVGNSTQSLYVPEFFETDKKK